MKVERQLKTPKFNPIIITLETRDEADRVLEAFNESHKIGLREWEKLEEVIENEKN